jgi:hypothetical protein
MYVSSDDCLTKLSLGTNYELPQISQGLDASKNKFALVLLNRGLDLVAFHWCTILL